MLIFVTKDGTVRKAPPRHDGMVRAATHAEALLCRKSEREARKYALQQNAAMRKADRKRKARIAKLVAKYEASIAR